MLLKVIKAAEWGLPEIKYKDGHIWINDTVKCDMDDMMGYGEDAIIVNGDQIRQIEDYDGSH